MFYKTTTDHFADLERDYQARQAAKKEPCSCGHVRADHVECAASCRDCKCGSFRRAA